MSNYRMSKGTTEHFTSLEEMRTAWGMKPVTKKTSDKKKLKEQQERFLSKHKCKASLLGSYPRDDGSNPSPAICHIQMYMPTLSV